MSGPSTQNSTKIYIGDLPQNVDEIWLENFVGEAAKPKSVIIHKEPHGRPQSYALLEFDSHDDAQRVISDLNYTKLDNVPIRISWFFKHPDRKANLFIKNLDPSIEVSQLHEAFSNFGEVLTCKIPLTDGKSHGYGFVQFINREDAESAMNDLKGAYIENKPIQIEPYEIRPHKSPESSFTNIYIKNLPDSIKNDEDLKKLFQKYGEVQNAHLTLNSDFESLHFGFCNMKKHEDAVEAVKGLNNTTIEGSDFALVVTRMKSKTERKEEITKNTRLFRHKKYMETKDRNFYIRGFDESVSEEELKNKFSEYGEIESIKLIHSQEGMNRRSAFVCFKDNESAAKFFKVSPTFKINEEQIYIAYFKPAEKRRNEKAQHDLPKTTEAPVTPINTPAQIPMKARDKLKAAINEKCGEDGFESKTYHDAARKLSEDQIAQINKNQESFKEWFESITNQK